MTRGVRHNRFHDPAVADCLRDVMEPEIGLSIIDFGLVYHASLGADGIDVMLTLTTRDAKCWAPAQEIG
jgi:metal-sulfur cluster biosynthetic enzyme